MSNQYKQPSTIFLYLSSLWLTLIFLLNPHYIELTGVLETWLPYKGLVYYKDFAAYHFPLGRLILLPLHLLTNWNLEFDPLVGLVTGITSLVIIYKFGEKFLTPWGTAISLTFFSSFFWFAATGILFFHEMLIGLLLALTIYLFYNANTQKKLTAKKLFILGTLISLTELSGQIATITLALLTLIILLRTTSPRKILSFILGIFLPTAIISLYFLADNAFREFFYYNVTYYLQYSGYERNLLGLPHLQLLAFYSPAIASALLLLANNTTKKNKISRLHLETLLLSLSTVPFIIFSVYHPHHLNYALPILAILAGFVYEHKKYFLPAIAIFLYVFATDILPWHSSRLVYPPSSKILNDTYPGDDMYKVIDWVKENTPENAKFMILGDSMFYLRSNRLPANRPAKGGIPYSWQPFEQIKKEILSSPPDYWVIGKTFTDRIIKNHDAAYMIDFVYGETNKCYKLRFNEDVWEIWERTCK